MLFALLPSPRRRTVRTDSDMPQSQMKRQTADCAADVAYQSVFLSPGDRLQSGKIPNLRLKGAPCLYPAAEGQVKEGSP
jgi:hypothetical protein